MSIPVLTALTTPLSPDQAGQKPLCSAPCPDKHRETSCPTEPPTHFLPAFKIPAASARAPPGVRGKGLSFAPARHWVQLSAQGDGFAVSHVNSPNSVQAFSTGSSAFSFWPCFQTMREQKSSILLADLLF